MNTEVLVVVVANWDDGANSVIKLQIKGQTQLIPMNID